MNNKIFIDLDKDETLPQLTPFQGLIDIKKNGKIIVKNSVLENIDTLSTDELRYALKNLKSYISPVITSLYIPSADMMKILDELAPEFKVRFKTEKLGANTIVPISSKEFFEGEKIFNEILKGIKPEWSEIEKYKYLYNRVCQMLSYDLNILSYTQYNGVHDKYSRNIFTSMSKNWGVCASFAASYDYLCYRAGLESQVLSEEDHDYVIIEHSKQGDFLTDPTFDAVRLKFGMKSKNFAISKKQFIENGHNLEETEAGDYSISELNDEEIKELDMQIDYLNGFGGKYTDEYIMSLGNNLEGKNNFEKIIVFLGRIRNIKTIGRPSVYDYETIINLILSESEDREFAEGVEVYSFISENTSELPRKIAVEVCDNNASNKEKQYYILENGVKNIKKVSKIEKVEEYREK